MHNHNTVRLEGAIATTPQHDFVGNDLPRLTFTLAGIDHVPNPHGDTPHTSAWYHHITLFGAYANTMQQRLRKGTPLSLTGRIRTNQYTRDGQRRTYTDVIADTITILDHASLGADSISVDAKNQPRLNDATNHIEISGNLTRDPATNTNGAPVTTFRVAINRPNRANDDTPSVDFIDVIAWDQHANTAARLRKGDLVIARGRLTTSSYERDGQRHYRTLINADRIRIGLRRATPHA